MADNRPPPYAWIAVAVVSPLAMLLPPRKFDLRFFLLSGSFSLSTDNILHHYTGQGIYARAWSRLGMERDLPSRAKETQRRLMEERARLAGMTVEERAKYEEAKKPKGLWKRWWAAEEGEDWHVKRAMKDKEAMSQGKGVSDLIMEQVIEVFGGKKEEPKGEGESKENKEENKEEKK